MIKELSIAVVLTLIFSVGVGVLFVRTIIEMIELLINGSVNHSRASENKEQVSI